MEWVQVFTIIVTMLGGIFVFYQITESKIHEMREQAIRMEEYHKEDMKSHREDMKVIDEKWERLFERLLIQDKNRNTV
jgi:hypothetical protein